MTGTLEYLHCAWYFIGVVTTYCKSDHFEFIKMPYFAIFLGFNTFIFRRLGFRCSPWGAGTSENKFYFQVWLCYILFLVVFLLFSSSRLQMTPCVCADCGFACIICVCTHTLGKTLKNVNIWWISSKSLSPLLLVIFVSCSSWKFKRSF